jgi:hypothetical protein
VPSARDVQRLAGVHPTLVAKISLILTQMEAKGTPMFVVVGVRTAEQEHRLWEQGRTAPGVIVTNCDGYTVKSNHQPHADGLGYAVDCAFLTGEPFALTNPWVAYGAAVEAQGLIWGGRFTSPVDLDHAELPVQPA